MDTATINSIDETNTDNGYVSVDVTISINSTDYSQVFTVNATDPVRVVANVKEQAESYRQQILASSETVTEAPDLSSLDGTVIDL